MKSTIFRFLSISFIFLIPLISWSQCTVDAFASRTTVICGDPVSLSAIGEGVSIFSEDFNDGNLDEWQVDPTGTFETNICGSMSPDGSNYLWFGESANAPRDAVTPCLDLRTGGTICFWMRYSGNEGGVSCENPDAADEGVTLQYRVNNAACNAPGVWTDINYWSPNGGNDPFRINWNQYCVNIPAGARQEFVQIRWVQLNNSNGLTGTPLDHWGIEDVDVIVNNPNGIYTWQHTGIPQPTGDTPDVYPVSDTVYTVVYEDGTNTCQASIAVSVIKIPVTATVDKSVICPGDQIKLDATDFLGKIPDQCGRVSDLTCDPIKDESGEVQIGSGNIVNRYNNGDANTFGDFGDAHNRTQIIYRANELSAQGFTGGKINGLQFEVGAIEPGENPTLANMIVSIGCTSQNSFGEWIGGLSTVFNRKSFTVGVGWNDIPLDFAYEWDGISNIVVQVCIFLPDGQSSGNANWGSYTRDHNPGFASVRQSSTNFSDYGSVGCNLTSFEGNHNNRPNTKFLFCKPNTSRVPTYDWDPDDGSLSNDKIKSPNGTPIVTTTYTVTANTQGYPDACATQSSVQVTVQDAPEKPIPTYNVGLCEGDALNLNFGSSALPPGPSYAWTGPGGWTSTAKNPTRANATPAMNGVYSVVVSSSAGCPSLAGTVNVSINPAPPAPTLGSNSPLCDGEELQLTSSLNGYKYEWTGPNGWTSTQKNPTRNDPSPNMNGQYSLVLENITTGCKSVTPTNINVVQTGLEPAPTLTANKLVLCPGEDLILSTTKPSGFFDPDFDFFFGHYESAWTNTQNGNGNITATRAGVTAAEAGTYYLTTLEDGANCPSDTAFVTVTIFDPSTMVASNDGPYCEGATINLEVTDAGAGSNYDWTGPGGYVANGRQVTRAASIIAHSGTYSVEIDNGICTTPITVTTDVVVQSSSNAGTNGNTTVCQGDAAVNLMTVLGGGPDPGGNWTDDDGSGQLTGSNFNPANVGTFNFTYTIPASGTCPEVSTVATVTVNQKPNAGTGNTFELCENAGSINLMDYLSDNPDASGTWNDDNASGGFTAPDAFDPIGLGGGSYAFTYTVAGVAPCVDATATVTFNIKPSAKAGTSTPATICNDNTSFDLFSTLAGNDAGGTWADDDGSNSLTGSSINATSINKALLPGSFDFTYTVSDPDCGVSSVTSSITINKAPVAGTDNTVIVCETSGSVTLLSELGGSPDAGGTWADLDASGSLTGGQFDPTGKGGNTYRFEYTVAGTPPCADAKAIVTVDVRGTSNPGTPSNGDLCATDNPFDLFTLLTGNDAGGTWNDDNGTGALSGSTLTPTNIASTSIPGSFNFTYSTTAAGCPVQTSTVTVNIAEPGNAGTDNTVSTCESGGFMNLFNQLGGTPDAGGSWNDLDGAGLSGNQFNPSGKGGNTYRFEYVIAGTPPCPDVKATVTVDVLNEANAGTPTNTTICETNTSFDLFDQLSGNDAGGTWTDVSGTGALTGSILDASAINSNDIPGTFTFKYEINAPGCTPKLSFVDITVSQQKKAGDDGTVTLCNVAGSFDLFDYIQGTYDNGGTWTDLDGSGALTGSNINPDGLVAGNYDFQYEVTSPAPCAADQSIITVTIIDQPVGGGNGNTTMCQSDNITLFDFLPNAYTTGGNWVDVNNSGGTLNGTSGAYNAATATPGTYTFDYDVSATSPCTNVKGSVTVTITASPVFGTPNINCSGDRTTFSAQIPITSGDPSTYNVSPAGGTIVPGPPAYYQTPAIASGGSATYTLTDANNCGSDQVTITMNCNCTTDPGSMHPDTLQVCGGTNATPNYLGTFINDGDDILTYFLYEGSDGVMTNIIARSTTADFAFDPATMNYNQVYFVSAGAGNDDGSGFADQNDVCFTLSNATPVVFREAITSAFTSDKTVICPGEVVTFNLNLQGSTTPYAISMSETPGSTNNFNFSGTDTTWTKSPTQNTLYSLISVSDTYGCVYSPATNITVNTNQAPVATVTTTGNGCSGNNPVFNVSLTGDGSDFELHYTSSLDGSTTVLNNLQKPDTNIYPTGFSPNSIVTYTLIYVADNSGSICPGVAQGTFDVYPTPTAQIVNSNATYCSGAAIDLTFNVTGLGPWDIDLSDGTNNYSVTVINDMQMVSVPNSLTPGTYTFTITNIVDQASGCSNSGYGTDAQIQINLGPSVQLDIVNSGTVIGNSETYCEDGSTRVLRFTKTQGSGNNFTINYRENNTPKQAFITDGVSVDVTVTPTTGINNYTIDNVQDGSPAGCSGTGNPVTITVKALPTVTTTLPASGDTICDGNNINIDYNLTGDGNITFDIVDLSTNTIVYTETGKPAGGPYTASFAAPPVGSTNTPLDVNYGITNIQDGTTPTCLGSNANTLTVTIIPLPTIAIATTQFEVCENGNIPITFTTTGYDQLNTTIVATNSDNGNVAQTITHQNTEGTYTESVTLPAGTYTFTATSVIDETQDQCSGTIVGQVDVDVIAAPTATLAFTDPTICFGEKAYLEVNPTGNAPFTIDISGTDGFDTTITVSGNSTLTFVANNDVTYTITSITDGTSDLNGNNCAGSAPFASAALTVLPLPTIDISGLTDICELESADIIFNVNGTAPFNVQYQDVRTGNIENITLPSTGTHNISHTPLDTVEYVIIGVQDGSVKQCINTGSGLGAINVKQLPDVAFTAPLTDGCAPFDITLNNLSTSQYGLTNCKWNVTDFGNFSDGNCGPLSLTLIDKQSYDVQLTVTNAVGCVDSLTKNSYLTVHPDPVAQFSYTPKEPTIIESLVQFYNQSRGAVNFTWDIGDVGTVTGISPIFQFPSIEDTTYQVCLTAANAYGCINTVCEDIFIKSVDIIYIPNAFTPDGDGINDTFKPSVIGIKEGSYTMQIFNRWGDMIFQTNNPDESWNGMIYGTEKVQDGLYTVKINAVTKNSGKDIFEMGFVNLMR